MRALEEFRLDDGMFDQFAWPGGYLIEWLTEDASLCAACATKASDEDGARVMFYIHEAGTDGYTCDECGNERK